MILSPNMEPSSSHNIQLIEYPFQHSKISEIKLSEFILRFLLHLIFTIYALSYVLYDK